MQCKLVKNLTVLTCSTKVIEWEETVILLRSSENTVLALPPHLEYLDGNLGKKDYNGTNIFEFRK